MNSARKAAVSAVLMTGAILILTGCGPKAEPPKTDPTKQSDSTKPPTTTPPTQTTPTPGTPAPSNPKQEPAVAVTKTPTAITVLVNKSIKLPDGYRPADLVEPNVPFIFAEKDEKRLMRKEAAQALEQMFAAAKKDGVNLAGVSGYRSYETQEGLFNYYVKTQGEEMARRYSAEPGHSEHQTGLVMDVSGSTGACAADPCFDSTPEAKWLAAHGAEYGFIVRYPEGKEAITGYAYESWHMRYLGVTMAKEIAAKKLTLEEYLSH